jgi:CDP-glucose 4,6-dehydratase
VLRGYRDPEGTFATNLSGTVHLLETLRGLAGVHAAVIVTTDKVYRNDGQGRPFIEDDPLGGTDPYSASKAAAEIVAASWRASFANLPPLSTARAGNVIGGGDVAEARLLPDIVRAQEVGDALVVRHPDATRPWQHVIDVLTGYLVLAEALVQRPAHVPAALNFGPADGMVSVRTMIERFAAASGQSVPWCPATERTAPEAPRLALDPGLAERVLGWRTRLDGERAVGLTAAWHAAHRHGEDLRRHALASIEEVWA